MATCVSHFSTMSGLPRVDACIPKGLRAGVSGWMGEGAPCRWGEGTTGEGWGCVRGK